MVQINFDAKEIAGQILEQILPVVKEVLNEARPEWMNIKEICDHFHLSKTTAYNTVNAGVREGKVRTWGKGDVLRVHFKDLEAYGMRSSLFQPKPDDGDQAPGAGYPTPSKRGRPRKEKGSQV